MDMVMGGMQPPNISSRGRQRGWPYLLLVIQAKQGQHQKAQQPEPRKKRKKPKYTLSRHTYEHLETMKHVVFINRKEDMRK